MKLAKISFLVAVAVAMTASCATPKQDTAQTVLDTIFARKSVRSYTEQDVTPEQVETLLKAAMSAPSGMNLQPWRFVVVRDQEVKDKLAGPRGGMILCREEYAKAIDKAIFPGTQGGPLEHVIAAKAVCFAEALTDTFKAYQHQIILNAKAMENAFREEGVRMVSGGTDNHLLLLDFTGTEMTGKVMENLLEEANITVNKNTVPNETRSPFVTSGIRVGTPAATSRGLKEPEMKRVAGWIARILREGESAVPQIKAQVEELMAGYPLY